MWFASNVLNNNCAINNSGISHSISEPNHVLPPIVSLSSLITISELIGGALDEAMVHSTTVGAPNVSIIIVNGDASGEPVSTAKVGDLLTLRFLITDDKSEWR